MSKTFFLHDPNRTYRPAIYRWLFLLALVVMAWVYNYHEILGMRPCSIHVWRQADCLSLTVGYYEGGMNFFTPAMQNLQADQCTSGLTAGEFPLLYYVVALLWKMFGMHEWIYRLLVTLIAFAGLWALYRLLEGLLKDSLWALLGSLLLFTSPTFVYYGNNFITNIPGLSFALIGCWMFFRFSVTDRMRPLWFSMLFFALAGLMKASSLLPFLMVIFIFLAETTRMMRFGADRKLFQRPGRQIWPILACIIAVTAWYAYAYYYNEIHGGKYTFNGLWPIWEIDSEKIAAIWKAFTHFLLRQLWAWPVLIVFGGSLITVTVLGLLRKFPLPWLGLLWLLAAGTAAYFLLWYQAFDAHDYYMTDLMYLPLACLAALMWAGKRHAPRLFLHTVTRLGFAALLTYAFLYEHNNIETRLFYGNRSEEAMKRYMSAEETGIWWYLNDHDKRFVRPFATMEAYNRSIGILPEDLVMVSGDGSINISLALMHQRGWTEFGHPKLPPYVRMETLIGHGARYLFVSDPSVYQEYYIKPFIRQKIGQYEGVDIYRIGN